MSKETEIHGGENLEFLLENFDVEKAFKSLQPGSQSHKQGFVLEGGSGSGKTYDILQFLITICESFFNKKNIDALIFRSTYAEAKKTVLKDFLKILQLYGIYNVKDHVRTDPQSYRLYGNIVHFSGLDKISAHGERHDILYGNEGIDLDFDAFKQQNQRCNMCFIIDYNPSVTEHWIYDNIITRPDTKFFHSTLLKNYYLPAGQRKEIMSYEPTAENIKNGTADEYFWKVYGLGLRTANKGRIFKYITWIKKLPDYAYVFGLDFGFTNDPTALTIVMKKDNNLYTQLLLYEPIDNSLDLSFALQNAGAEKHETIYADSSDKYNDVEMVKELRNLGWNIKKVSKAKGLLWRIGQLKKHKIHIVFDNNVKREVHNYKWKEINGQFINQPIDKFNHFWDSFGYGFLGMLKTPFAVK